MLPLVSFLVIFYFGVHALNSLKSQGHIQEDITLLEQQYAEINSHRRDLEKHVSLLHPDHVDPDYLDEKAREILGYIHPDEVIIVEKVQ